MISSETLSTPPKPNGEPFPSDEAEPQQFVPPSPAFDLQEWRASVSALVPVIVGLAALAIHFWVPNQQELPLTWLDGLKEWQHPYPVVLIGMAAISFFLSLVQWGFTPLRPMLNHHGPLVGLAMAVVCLWEIMTAKLDWLSLPFFPGPDLILAGMIEDRYLLLESTWHSLKLLLAGYLFGVAGGLVTGVLLGWFPRVRYWGMPAFKLVGPIPATALVPLAMTLFATPFLSGMTLIGFAVWFPVTMLTASGISNVRLSYLDVARTLGASRYYLIFRVAIPAAMPNIFIGLFMGLGASFLTLIVAETVGVKAGLGFYRSWQQGYAEYGKVYASLFIMAVFFSTMMTLLFKVRDRVLTWQKGVIKW